MHPPSHSTSQGDTICWPGLLSQIPASLVSVTLLEELHDLPSKAPSGVGEKIQPLLSQNAVNERQNPPPLFPVGPAPFSSMLPNLKTQDNGAFNNGPKGLSREILPG